MSHVSHSYELHPGLVLEPGEVWVSWGDERVFPALVDPTDQDWNGFVSPAFRSGVALALADYVNVCNAATPDPEIQDHLAVAPDRRTIVHLVADVDEDGVWRLEPLAVHQLDDNGRARIGAWHWTWHVADLS